MVQEIQKAGTARIEIGANRLRAWREGSVNRRIFAALITVASLGMVVKIAATLKEVVVARQFGVSDYLDAFLIAYLVPSFAINVVAGSFNAALIPAYVQTREQGGKQAAQKLLSSVLALSVALLLVVAIALALAAPHILPMIGSSFSAEKIGLTRSLFFILLPVLPLTGIATIWAAVLNAGERFALAAIVPIITPVVVMAAASEFAGAAGVYSIATAILIGAVIECALLGAALRRQGISVVPRWRGLNPSVKQVMKQYAPMIAASCTISSTVLVDQAMAAMLGRGSVSVLSYGNKMAAVIVSVGSLALSSAVLPQFSRMAAAADWDGVKKTLRVYTRLILAVTIPAAVIFILLSRPIVNLLFERGAFTAEDAEQVAEVQRLYMLQLPFYALGMLFVPLLSAFKANHILMWGTLISFALNLALDYILMRQLGVPGIALATSMVYMVGFFYKAIMSRRLLKRAQAQS